MCKNVSTALNLPNYLFFRKMKSVSFKEVGFNSLQNIFFYKIKYLDELKIVCIDGKTLVTCQKISGTAERLKRNYHNIYL